MKRSEQKIGFIATYSMMVASVIGIGIFLKNNSVFRGTGYNPLSTILAWVVVAVACLFLAISYADISANSQSRAGLSKWAADVSGYRFTRFIKVNYTFFYYGLTILTIAYYAGEMILVNLKPLFNDNLLKDGLGDYSSVGLTLAAGTLLLLLFLIFNYWSIKASGVFQTFSLILKFLPLLAVSVFGFLCFFLFVSSSDKSLWGKWWSEQLASTATDASSNKPFKFEFNRMVVVIPAILFAFDGFVGFGALAPDVKRAKKRMPLIFVLGMLSIIFIYLAVTLAQTFTSQGISWNVFKEENLFIFTSNKDLQATLSDIITKVFQGLIFVSILGVLNSFCASSINIFREQVESYGIIGAKKLLKITKNDGKKAGLLLLFLFISFWSIPNCFLAFYWNTDFFIDGISNFPTLFFFLVYALVPLLTTIQKIRYQTRLTFKNLLYGFYSLIGFLTISAIILYQVIYIFCYQQGVIRYDVKNDLGWGGFLELDVPEITGFIVCIILLVMLSIFIFTPLINQGMVSFFTLKRAVSYYDIKKVRGELTEFQLLTNKDNFHFQSPKPLLNEKDQLLFSVLTVERKNFLKRKQHLLQLQKAWGKSVYDQLGKNF